VSDSPLAAVQLQVLLGGLQLRRAKQAAAHSCVRHVGTVHVQRRRQPQARSIHAAQLSAVALAPREQTVQHHRCYLALCRIDELEARKFSARKTDSGPTFMAAALAHSFSTTF